MTDGSSGRRPVAQGSAGPRRSPLPEERQRDAERSRQQLLDAALEEFSAKGFAGARVKDIADRAGVNKQLINYYFESKAGLYREIQRVWLAREATFADPDAPLDELIVRYLHDASSDPRLMRLLVWRGLTDGAEQPPDDSPGWGDLSSMRRRQARGELAPDLDPAAVRLAALGMVLAPIALPHMARRIFGIDPRTPEFEERYGRQLRLMIRHLAVSRPADRPS